MPNDAQQMLLPGFQEFADANPNDLLNAIKHSETDSNPSNKRLSKGLVGAIGSNVAWSDEQSLIQFLVKNPSVQLPFTSKEQQNPISQEHIQEIFKNRLQEVAILASLLVAKARIVINNEVSMAFTENKSSRAWMKKVMKNIESNLNQSFRILPIEYLTMPEHIEVSAMGSVLSKTIAQSWFQFQDQKPPGFLLSFDKASEDYFPFFKTCIRNCLEQLVTENGGDQLLQESRAQYAPLFINNIWNKLGKYYGIEEALLGIVSESLFQHRPDINLNSIQVHMNPRILVKIPYGKYFKSLLDVNDYPIDTLDNNSFEWRHAVFESSPNLIITANINREKHVYVFDFKNRIPHLENGIEGLSVLETFNLFANLQTAAATHVAPYDANLHSGSGILKVEQTVLEYIAMQKNTSNPVTILNQILGKLHFVSLSFQDPNKLFSQLTLTPAESAKLHMRIAALTPQILQPQNKKGKSDQIPRVTVASEA